MDEDAYREAYREINPRRCLFEKGILTNQCRCALVERLCLAEREAARCSQDSGLARCQALLDKLRKPAQFALKARGDKTELPHAKAIKLQIGGLRGLHVALYPEQEIPVPIPDVATLIQQAIDTFGSLDELPHDLIVPQIAAFEGRKRRRRGS